MVVDGIEAEFCCLAHGAGLSEQDSGGRRTDGDGDGEGETTGSG